jgi:hypothetical protein
VVVAPSEVTGRYCRLDVSDTANTDAHLSVALAYAGPVWAPTTGLGWGSGHGRSRGEQVVETRGGQEHVTPLWQRRTARLEFDAIPAADLWTQQQELDRAASNGGNVLLIPDTSSATIAREALFGRLRGTADVTYPVPGASQHRRWTAEIAERL